MSRGKPCPEQLKLSMDMLKILNKEEDYICDGIDTRNYGVLEGIKPARKLFAELLEVSENEVIVGGNSSLNMMHDAIARAFIFGVPGGKAPWGVLPKVRFLCPSPGYDRHFAICEAFGIEMIPVEMKQDGPDMDEIERIVSSDESVKGIWCVPKYSNPDGISYSDDVVRRFANLKPKAPDFRIFWDNAYVVHHLSDEHDEILNILEECKKAGNPDMVYIFASTSKITFPGAGIAAMAASETNIKYTLQKMAVQTICPDKTNQLRHVRFLKSVENINELMKKHAAIIAPKFAAVLETLERELGGKEIAWWNKPRGGYFISLYTLDGCAKEVVAMAAEAGVKLTNAGATYPYGRDPRDRNIRIAPTYPAIEDLKKAIEILCVCVQLVSAKKMLSGEVLSRKVV